MVKSDIFPNYIIPESNIPWHSQAADRHTKLVTYIAAEVIGAQKRNGLIRTTLQSHKQMTQFDTRSQFMSLRQINKFQYARKNGLR